MQMLSRLNDHFAAVTEPYSTVRRENRAELSMGPFCLSRSNPTHQLTDPSQPNPLQEDKKGPNPTQPNANCHWLTLSLFITPSDRFLVPVRSAVKSDLTVWCNKSYLAVL